MENLFREAAEKRLLGETGGGITEKENQDEEKN